MVKGIARWIAPEASQTLTRSLTMPRTNTISGRGTISGETAQGKEVPYISFSAVVGRNSRFTALTDEQKDELGGVEYRALRVLLYIVIGVGRSHCEKNSSASVLRFYASRGLHHYRAVHRSWRAIRPCFSRSATAGTNTLVCLISVYLILHEYRHEPRRSKYGPIPEGICDDSR